MPTVNVAAFMKQRMLLKDPANKHIEPAVKVNESKSESTRVEKGTLVSPQKPPLPSPRQLGPSKFEVGSDNDSPWDDEDGGHPEPTTLHQSQTKSGFYQLLIYLPLFFSMTDKASLPVFYRLAIIGCSTITNDRLFFGVVITTLLFIFTIGVK